MAKSERHVAKRKKGAVMAPKTIPSVSPRVMDAQEGRPRGGTNLSEVGLVTHYRTRHYVTLLHKLGGAHMGCVLTKENIINSGEHKIKVYGGYLSVVEVICPSEVASRFPGLRLTQKELAVTDAVCTLIEDAELLGLPPRMTAKMIYETMPGQGTHPSKARLKEIEDIMWKLRHLWIKYVANPAEIAARRVSGRAKPAIFADTFFAYRIIGGDDYGPLPGIDQSGNVVMYYDFEGRKPVAFDIAERTGQILKIHAEYVQVDGRMNDRKMHMVRYLAQRVGHIIRTNDDVGTKTGGNHILLDSIFEFLDASNASDDTKQRIRSECVERYLDHLKTSGWIKEYKLLDMDGKEIKKGDTRGRKLRCYAIEPVGGVKKPKRKKAQAKACTKSNQTALRREKA